MYVGIFFINLFLVCLKLRYVAMIEIDFDSHRAKGPKMSRYKLVTAVLKLGVGRVKEELKGVLLNRTMTHDIEQPAKKQKKVHKNTQDICFLHSKSVGFYSICSTFEGFIRIREWEVHNRV